MDTCDYQAEMFKALAHPVRLQILDILRDGERCVCHIEAVLGQRQAYVSQQLMILRKAELVADRRDDLRVYYRLVNRAVFRVLDPARAMAKQEGATFAPVTERAPHNCPCPSCSPA